MVMVTESILLHQTAGEKETSNYSLMLFTFFFTTIHAPRVYLIMILIEQLPSILSTKDVSTD